MAKVVTGLHKVKDNPFSKLMFAALLLVSSLYLAPLKAQISEPPRQYIIDGLDYPFIEIDFLLDAYFPTSASFGLGSFPDSPGRIATIATLGRGDVPACGGVPGNTRGWFVEFPPSTTHLGLMDWENFGYFRLVSAPCVDIRATAVFNDQVCESFVFSFCSALILGHIIQSDPDWLGNTHPYIHADRIVYLENNGVVSYLINFISENPDILSVD